MRPLNFLDATGLQSFDRFNRCNKFRWGDHYNRADGKTSGVVSLNSIGLLEDYVKSPSVAAAMERSFNYYKRRLFLALIEKCRGAGGQACLSDSKVVSGKINARDYDDSYDVTEDGDCMEPIGKGDLFNNGGCAGSMVCNSGEFHGSCSLKFYIRDKYKNPYDYYSFGERVGLSFETGTSYKIHADWIKVKSW